MNDNNKRTEKVVFSGIMSAISVLLGLTAVFLPFNKLFILFIMSLVMCIVTQKQGEMWAIWTLSITTLLMFLLAGDKSVPIEYALFFGIYPIVKYIIEKRQYSLKKEIIIKSVWWTVVSAAIIVLAHFVVGGTSFWGDWYSESKLIPFLIFAVLLPIEAVYDVALTYAISLLNKRLFKF